MPPNQPNTIPGIPGTQGTDYEIVNYAGRYYVVYKTKLPNGTTVNDAWRIGAEDYKKLGIAKRQIKHITQSQFKGIEVFGDFGEIAIAGSKGERPLQTYLKSLREIYGAHASWLGDKQYMETFLMGYMENWDPGELQQRLKLTKWYQSRTAAQRSWELDMNKADRRTALETSRTQVQDALKDLYGTVSLQEAGITSKDLDQWSKDIASGKYGDPSVGFQTWLERQTNQAEKIEGTAAWIDRQTVLEEQRGFMNRPEDMFEQIRSDALEWLGPKGMPDKQTLMGWAEGLVSERRSDGDWQKYLRQSARSLYPWLGPDERWQDRASMYKNIIEDEMGTTVGFDHPWLTKIGSTDDSGKATGTAMDFQDYTSFIRNHDDWWTGKKASDLGFDLANTLNSLFRGVS